MNGFTETEAQKYTFGEELSLYKYSDGKWQLVPMKDNWGFNDIGYIATGKTPSVTISGFFKMFDCKFTDGLYRIKTTYTSGAGGYPPQGTLKSYNVIGEFNLEVSPSAYLSQLNDEETIKTMYSFKTDKNSYSVDFDAIQATLTNTNAGSVGCAYAFRVEKQTGNEWQEVRIYTAFIEPHITLRVGGTFNGYVLKPDMLADKLEKGNYRIVTNIQVEGNSVEATAVFSIV